MKTVISNSALMLEIPVDSQVNLSFWFWWLCLLVLMACNSPSKELTSTKEIPVLLTRSEKIGSSEERGYMLSTYSELKNKLWANPDDFKARLQLARLFMVEARATGEHGHYYPAALEMLDYVRKVNPDPDNYFQALFLSASVQLSLHNFQEAKQLAEEAVKLNPNYSQVYGALVDAYVELGEYDAAVEMADKMVSLKPDLRSYARVSYLREIHGDIEGAIYAMKLAIGAGLPGMEDHAWCRLTLGELFKRYGRFEEAEAQFQSILEERADYPFAIAALGELAMEQGDLEKAEKQLEEACAIIPEVGFYIQLASLNQRVGRDTKAEEILAEVLEMLEDDVVNGHSMNMEYAALYRDHFNDLEKALQYAQIEYEARPKNIDVNRLMASIYVAQGEKDKAMSHMKAASHTGSKDPELLNLKAELEDF